MGVSGFRGLRISVLAFSKGGYRVQDLGLVVGLREDFWVWDVGI